MTAYVTKGAWAVIFQNELVALGNSDGRILPACFALDPEVVPRDEVREALSCLQVTLNEVAISKFSYTRNRKHVSIEF